MISFTKGKLKFVQVPYNARIVCNVYLPTEIYIQQQWFLLNATMNDFWAKLLRRDLRSQFSGGNFSEYSCFNMMKFWRLTDSIELSLCKIKSLATLVIKPMNNAQCMILLFLWYNS